MVARTDARILDAIDHAVQSRLGDGLFVLGLCGAQGSGKSTVAAALANRWNAADLPTAILSLDDLYKTKADRAALAEEIHPLLATRGPPGTHDVALGMETIAALAGGNAVALPRFDKAVDDRVPEREWPLAAPGTRILIFEGWCVGVRPQPDADLAHPINALERHEDADARWRTYVNRALAGDYRGLFGKIDLLTLLAAPDFAVVEGWRTEQEQALRREGRGGMTDAEIVRFIQHYERLTRHILATMPGHADLVIGLDVARRPTAIEAREG